MPRKVTGIRRRRNAWNVYVRVNRRLYTKTFPLDTPVREMRKWREEQSIAAGGGVTEDAARAAAEAVRAFLDGVERVRQSAAGRATAEKAAATINAYLYQIRRKR
jgi:hypothetical protein